MGSCMISRSSATCACADLITIGFLKYHSSAFCRLLLSGDPAHASMLTAARVASEICRLGPVTYDPMSFSSPISKLHPWKQAGYACSCFECRTRICMPSMSMLASTLHVARCVDSSWAICIGRNFIHENGIIPVLNFFTV